MEYYNTNKESESELKSSIEKASCQSDIIMEYFNLHPSKMFTPFEIQNALGWDKVPITSIRRAMTNLTNKNKLEKTDEQKNGDYGKKNYCWKLKSNNNDMYAILEEERQFQKTVLMPEPVQSNVIVLKEPRQQRLF